MFYKEIKDLLNQLNNENVEELKVSGGTHTVL